MTFRWIYFYLQFKCLNNVPCFLHTVSRFLILSLTMLKKITLSEKITQIYLFFLNTIQIYIINYYVLNDILNILIITV